jgi:hypothetical protein
MMMTMMMMMMNSPVTLTKICINYRNAKSIISVNKNYETDFSIVLLNQPQPHVTKTLIILLRIFGAHGRVPNEQVKLRRLLVNCLDSHLITDSNKR